MPGAEKEVSANDVAHGCLISYLVMIVGTLSISLVFTEWLGWLDADREKIVAVGSWFIAICIGGYVAARRAERSGQRPLPTALWVGAAALMLVVARLPEPADGDFMDALREVLLRPRANLRHFLLLLGTVPAALLGGILARPRGN